MEINVSISFQGHPREVALLLSQLASSLLDEPVEDWTQDDEAWWTPEATDAFLGGLTDTALLALRTIAEHAPNISFADFQREMGIAGPALAGKLSSIGFAVARNGAPHPFVRDYYQRAYLMDPKVAAILRDAIPAELRRRHGPRRRVSPPV